MLHGNFYPKMVLLSGLYVSISKLRYALLLKRGCCDINIFLQICNACNKQNAIFSWYFGQNGIQYFYEHLHTFYIWTKGPFVLPLVFKLPPKENLKKLLKSNITSWFSNPIPLIFSITNTNASTILALQMQCLHTLIPT